MKAAIFHLLIYLLILSFLNLYIGKQYARYSLWLLSFLFTLTASALLSYSVDWKTRLRPDIILPTVSSSNKDKKELQGEDAQITSSEPQKAAEEELSYFQLIVFTPLAFIYLMIRISWLYFRLCIYYFLDAFFALISSVSVYLVSIEWHNHFAWLQTTASEMLESLKEACAPFLDEVKQYFPYAYDAFTRFLKISLQYLSKLASWAKRYFLEELIQPIVEELSKGLKSFWGEIQPELLRLKNLLFAYLSFVTTDIIEEFKSLFTWAYTWLVKVFSSLDYASFQRLCHNASVCLINLIKAVISLHEINFQLLIDQAKKNMTHYLTTEMVDFGVMLPHVFSFLLSWGEEFSNMWFKEIPSLLLNILVWLLEDVIPPGSDLLIRANKHAWESSRVAYRFIKRVSFNFMEDFNAFVTLPIQTLVSFIYARFVWAIPFFNATMEYLSYLGSYGNAVFSKVSTWVSFGLAYILMEPMAYICRSWIPRLTAHLEAYQEKLDRLMDSEAETGERAGKSLALAMAPYAKFVATEIQSALVSFTHSLEYWVTQQVPEAPQKPASKPTKAD